MKKVYFDLPAVTFVFQPHGDEYNKCGYWEQMGRDRIRFLNRIKTTEKLLNNILLNKIETCKMNQYNKTKI